MGRPATKRFLADIVHNRRSGLDVDKLDYLARDAMSVLGASRPLPIDRLLGAARVAVRAEQHVLAFDEGVAGDVAETFALRARLHRQIYQQRAVLVAENLLVDLMAARDADAAPRLLDAARDADAAPRLLDAARDADAAPRLLDAARDADAFLALNGRRRPRAAAAGRGRRLARRVGRPCTGARGSRACPRPPSCPRCPRAARAAARHPRSRTCSAPPAARRPRTARARSRRASSCRPRAG